LEATYRSLLSIDWVILLYIIALLLLVTANKYSGYKFLNFSKLILTDTYLKAYRDDSLFKPFHIVIVIFSMLFFPLIIQVILFYLNILNQLLVLDYLKVGGVFLSFFLIKMFCQLILGKVLGLKDKIQHYVFEKQTYFSYLIFLSILPLLFLIFMPVTTSLLVYLLVILWVVLFVLAMFLVITHFKELLFSYPLYFILYLCTFEIAPLLGAVFYMKRL